MTNLKEVLRQEPEHAIALYLLAVQHAELGLLERAISGMKAALARRPQLEIARFQLGLMLMDRNRPSEAKQHFSALGDSRDLAMRAYSEAMTALINDNATLAREKIALGLSEVSANPALSTLMRSFLKKLTKSDDASANDSDAQASQVFLGAYRQTAR